MAGRTEEFYGAHSIDALFPHGALTTTVPWQQSGPTKTHRAFDVHAVHEALTNPDRFKTQNLDPRPLRATQPGLQRPAAKYYLDDDTYRRTGETFADKGKAGNQTPVVFHNQDTDHLAILSGHHRAAASLLRGDQFKAIVVSGKPTTHIEAAHFQNEVADMQRRARMAAREADKG